MLLFLIAFLFSTHISATSKVIVTAEKISLDEEKTNSNVEVISESEIIDSGESNLTDLIQRKSSVFVNSNGIFGKSTSLFLRGADSSYTLIVIDGIEYNDRSSVGGAAILDHIDLSSVEKIEILKGAQSVLYGSDAMAGVIRITTKNPGEDLGSKGSLSYGSYDNKRASFSTSQKGKNLDYSMGMSFHDVEGISSYNEKRTVMAEKDGMNNLTATFKGRKKFNKTDSLEFNLRGVKAESDFDANSGDKLDYMGRDSQIIAGVKYKKVINDYWIPELSVNYSKSDRLSNSFSLSRLVAKTKKIELSNPFYINENITLLNGIEYEDIEASIESINNKKSFNSSAVYLDTHFVYSRFSLQLGGRWTKEKVYSDRFVWKAGAGLNITNSTRLKANYSTGFKSPSLYQLYSSFGDESLSPTKSKSYDFGIVQNVFSTELSATAFKDAYENVIDFESTLNKYSNTFKSKTEGVELLWKGSIESFDWSLSATLLRAVNESKGSEGTYLARRPREKYFLGTGYEFSERVKTSLNYTYIGQRENSDFDTIVLSSYSLIDLGVNYTFSKGHDLLLKIGNLLDKEYEQVDGFGTMGRNFLLRYNFRI